MASSFGHIRKRDNGSYRCYWSAGGVRHSKQFKTYKQATAHLARMRLSNYAIDFNIKYGDYYKTSIIPTFEPLSERTRSEYERAWEDLRPYVENRPIAITNWSFVQQTINNYSSNSRQRKVKMLWSKILHAAQRDGIIQNTSCIENITLKRPRVSLKGDLYTKEELIDILKKIQGTRYALAVLLMCVCGLRLEEYCGLNRRDFDFGDYGWVYVSVNKAVTTVNSKRVLKEVKTTLSERSVALHSDFIMYLSEHFEYMKNKRSLNEYLNPAPLNRNWKRYCDSHDLKYLPLGYMRSVYATLSAEAGCLDSIVSKSMGHTGVGVREKNYLSATMQALKLNAATLAEYISFDFD